MTRGRLVPVLPARIASALLAACLVATASWSSAAQSGGPPSGQGGEVRFAANFEPDSLDPHVAAGSSSFLVLMNVSDTLVLLSPDDKEFHPYLADAWTVSDDGTVYTFKLRDGVTFHDGTPFDAEAVKFNLDRIVDPETKSSLALDLPRALRQLGGHRRPDDRGHMSRSPTRRCSTRSARRRWRSCRRRGAGQRRGDRENPVGTGFMKFSAYTPKEKIEFVRNEDYNWAPDIWGHTGPAYLEKFTFIVADEPAARVTALECGDATGIEDTPGQDVARLRGRRRFQLIKARAARAPADASS